MGPFCAKIDNIESILFVICLESKSICLSKSEEFRLIKVVTDMWFVGLGLKSRRKLERN